jgi:hypothetical protein
MPNLTTFGATEYMDGALTLPVLDELFLRGAPSRGRRRGRALIDGFEDDHDRRRQCKDLEAIDFTGCVSAVFVNALTEFVTTHLLQPQETRLNPREDALSFPGLQRLGLRGAKSILPHILTPFVLAFPSLTHLDLSGTRTTPELLYSLGDSPTIRLTSLALARCVKLTGDSIRDLLVNSPTTSQLTELNLYGDVTFVSPLSDGNIRDIFTLAPCFTKQNLVYLDISSSPLTKELLDLCRPLPKLRSLGLSHIPDLSVGTIADFVRHKTCHLEVLTLIGTSPELDSGRANGAPRGFAMQSSIALHTQLIRPLCNPPFSFSLTASSSVAPPPTQLRVIELSTALLATLGTGAGNWRIIRSKGGRGWYVDTASGWVAEHGSEGIFRRDLPSEHPFRVEMERLSDANGNVSSGVGWHARKMEVRMVIFGTKHCSSI